MATKNKKTSKRKDKRPTLKVSEASRDILQRHVEVFSPKTSQSGLADFIIKEYDKTHPLETTT